MFIHSDNKSWNIRRLSDKMIRLLVSYVQSKYRLQSICYKTLFKLSTILLDHFEINLKLKEAGFYFVVT